VKYLFTFLLIASFAKSNAQTYPEFAPVGATWIYHASFAFMSNDVHYNVVAQSIGTDTMYGKVCKHISVNDAVFGTYTFDFYCYRDSLRMYVLFDSTEWPGEHQWRLYCDFSKNIGDTVILPFLGSSIDTAGFIITDKGIVNQGGFELPYFDLYPYEPFVEWFDGRVILNIGSEQFFIPAYFILPPSVVGLECYKDSVLGLYTTNLAAFPCWPLSTANISTSEFTVSSNPSCDKFMLYGSLEADETIELQNLIGQTVLTKRLGRNENNIEVDIGSLQGGIYLLTVKDNEQLIYITKIVKVH
jgi:hypothetical protein